METFFKRLQQAIVTKLKKIYCNRMKMFVAEAKQKSKPIQIFISVQQKINHVAIFWDPWDTKTISQIHFVLSHKKYFRVLLALISRKTQIYKTKQY